MKTICIRLHRGDDLLRSIQSAAAEHGIRAGVLLSGVGCLLCARVRDASGATVRDIPAACEIVSLTGTVSEERCHLHISVSTEDLATLGGHLMPGCTVNTTCELIIGILPEWTFSTEEDEATGYDEIVFRRLPE